jgi:hypothetical protein
VLDPDNGKWYALNPTAGELLLAWQEGSSFEAGVDALTRHYPHVAPTTLRADAGRLLGQLVERQLVRVHLRDGGAAVLMARAGAHRKWVSTWRQRLLWAAAPVCVFLAVLAARLPFRLICAVLRGLRRWWCGEPLTIRRASTVVTAVQNAGAWYPFRMACLEQSLAAVLLAALCRRRLDWCLGAAADPYRFHAWVEVDGSVVPALDGQVEDVDYQRIVSV